MSGNKLFRRGSGRRAYSLMEVIVALAILVIGIVGVLRFFPPSLRAASEASLRGKATLLAQMKVEELRRDADQNGSLVNSIKTLSQPTDPVPFPQDNRLVYQYSSRSFFSPTEDLPGNPDDDFGVARVVVRYNKEFRPAEDVLVELRFDR
jgi:prepilin-type N-terminal cleavage/methylation domain-containing protein